MVQDKASACQHGKKKEEELESRQKTKPHMEDKEEGKRTEENAKLSSRQDFNLNAGRRVNMGLALVKI